MLVEYRRTGKTFDSISNDKLKSLFLLALMPRQEDSPHGGSKSGPWDDGKASTGQKESLPLVSIGLDSRKGAVGSSGCGDRQWLNVEMGGNEQVEACAIGVSYVSLLRWCLVCR
ncbi:hypothetical protein V8C44DRAFT_31837 [Trichoderma aethiopicum]